MFFSVSPIKPGFRRRRRAAPLRLFQFLRNCFFSSSSSSIAPGLFFFLLLSSSCAFSRGAALERISVSHFKAAAPQVPDAAVKVRGVRLRLSNQPMFRRTRWAATQFFQIFGENVFPITRFFSFQYEFSIDFGGKGFSNGPLLPPCGPFVAPLWPLVAPCGPLWPAVARLWPLVAPLFSTGEPLKNFRVARCAGHRATGPPEIFQRFGFFVFFSFFGRRSTRRRKERIILSLLFLYRRPSAEK